MEPSELELAAATAEGARMVAVVAEVERKRLAALLPASLEPRRLYGAMGALSLQFIDIPESPLGPYRECTVSVLCKDTLAWPEPTTPDTWRSMPGFPIWIGVTSERARHFGREVWQYPKYLADVDIQLDGTSFRARVSHPDGVCIRCTATLPTDLERQAVEFRSLSFGDSGLLMAPMPGVADFTEYWDPEADYELDLRQPGLGIESGRATSGLYAADLSFELLRPIPAQRTA